MGIKAMGTSLEKYDRVHNQTIVAEAYNDQGGDPRTTISTYTLGKTLDY